MPKYSIKRAAVLLMFVTIIEKLLGFGREMVIASQFGASGLTDAYVGGFLIPNFIVVLLSAGLVNIYAPVFLSEIEIDEEAAWNKINSISTYTIVMLSFITIGGIIFSRDIVTLLYHKFSQESINAATSISRVFFIGVFVYSGAIIESSLLNSFRHFLYPAVSVGLLSLGTIVWVLLFGGNYNINSIAYGYLAGAGAGFIIQYIKLSFIKAKLHINFKFYKKFTSGFLKLLFPVLVATSMSQVNLFVDTIFASYLSSGSMSYLSYAGKVTQLPILIFSGIIATIIFPDLIEFINKKDFNKLRVYLNRAIVITFIFLIPSFTGLIVLNREVIELLFQRNAFDSIATARTASALVCYSPTVVLYGIMTVLSKVYYSMKDTVTLMYISIVTILLNVLFDYILMWPMGHNGLAIATSIVAVFQLGAAYFVLKKKLGIIMDSYVLKNLFKVCIASICMAIAIYMLKLRFTLYSVTGTVILSIITGVAVYFFVLAILRVDELSLLKNKYMAYRDKQ